MNKDIYIFGTGTLAKKITILINKYNLYNIIGYVVDSKYKDCGSFFDKPVFSLESFNTSVNMFIAYGWNNLNKDRRNLYERLNEQHNLVNVISPKSSIYGELKGNNCWIADNVIINAESVINSNVFIDSNGYVGCNTKIKDHCYLAVGSTVAGGCTISEQTFIGIRATVIDEVFIGEKCLIGAGTTVKRNVVPYSLIKTMNNNQETKLYDEHTIENKLNFKRNVR